MSGGPALRLWRGLSGGVAAGVLVGLADALSILSRASTGEYLALLYGALLYGVVGASAGLGVGVLLVVAGRRLAPWVGWIVAFQFALLGMALPLVRARAARDLFLDHAVPASWDVGLAVAALVLLVVGTWFGGILLTRTPLKVLPTPRGTVAALAALLALVALLSYAPAPRGAQGTLVPETGPVRPPADAADVVLVVVDGLRADHVGDLTPAIARLGDEGVVFEQAVTHATWTRGAVASLLTSLVPAGHGCVSRPDGLRPEVLTLAEVLLAAGFATGAVVNSPELGRGFGMSRGFAWYRASAPARLPGATESVSRLALYRVLARQLERRESPRIEDYYRPAEAVLEDARLFVEANREAGHRFFLLVHLMEPHEPWFDHPADGRAAGRAWDLPAAEAQRLYRAEVAHADARLGEFLQWLEQLGAWRDTFVVVTADHGQELGDHGGWWHGTTLYEEVVRVPLVMKLPGGALAGSRVPWPVCLVDVAPTLARRVGVDPPEGWRGRDLLDGDAVGLLEDLAAGEPVAKVPTPPCVMSQDVGHSSLAGVRADAWKYVRAAPDNPHGLAAEELYDLAADPKERQDLAGHRGARQADLSRQLRLALEEAARRRDVETAGDLSCGECERRRVLGAELDCGEVCGGEP